MNVLDVPFNKFLGIGRSESDQRLELQDNPSYLNHVGTVQAAVQLALAEAASGDWLLKKFPELDGKTLPVLRKVEAKFRNLLRGKVAARVAEEEGVAEAFLQSIASKGRAFITLHIEVVDGEGSVGLSSSFEWYVQMLA